MMLVTSAKTYSSTDRQPAQEPNDRPSEIYQRCRDPKYTLRYTLLPSSDSDKQAAKEDSFPVVGDGSERRFDDADADAAGRATPTAAPPQVAITLSELQQMATRQHYQIVAKEKMLAAKEQRLRLLKDQDARVKQLSAENERLSRLKECVLFQEQKLQQLRVLKEQVEQNRANNVAIAASVSNLRAVGLDKEREVTTLTAKAATLTRLLEDTRSQRKNTPTISAVVVEKDKLRQQLAHYAQHIEQQKVRVGRQRESVAQRLSVLRDVNKRVETLQGRLERQRALNKKHLAAKEAKQLPRAAEKISTSSSPHPPQTVVKSHSFQTSKHIKPFASDQQEHKIKSNTLRDTQAAPKEDTLVQKTATLTISKARAKVQNIQLPLTTYPKKNDSHQSGVEQERKSFSPTIVDNHSTNGPSNLHVNSNRIIDKLAAKLNNDNVKNERILRLIAKEPTNGVKMTKISVKSEPRNKIVHEHMNGATKKDLRKSDQYDHINKNNTLNMNSRNLYIF